MFLLNFYQNFVFGYDQPHRHFGHQVPINQYMQTFQSTCKAPHPSPEKEEQKATVGSNQAPPKALQFDDEDDAQTISVVATTPHTVPHPSGSSFHSPTASPIKGLTLCPTNTNPEQIAFLYPTNGMTLPKWPVDYLQYLANPGQLSLSTRLAFDHYRYICSVFPEEVNQPLTADAKTRLIDGNMQKLFDTLPIKTTKELVSGIWIEEKTLYMHGTPIDLFHALHIIKTHALQETDPKILKNLGMLLIDCAAAPRHNNLLKKGEYGRYMGDSLSIEMSRIGLMCMTMVPQDATCTATYETGIEQIIHALSHLMIPSAYQADTTSTSTFQFQGREELPYTTALDVLIQHLAQLSYFLQSKSRYFCKQARGAMDWETMQTKYSQFIAYFTQQRFGFAACSAQMSQMYPSPRLDPAYEAAYPQQTAIKTVAN